VVFVDLFADVIAGVENGDLMAERSSREGLSLEESFLISVFLSSTFLPEFAVGDCFCFFALGGLSFSLLLIAWSGWPRFLPLAFFAIPEAPGNCLVTGLARYAG